MTLRLSGFITQPPGRGQQLPMPWRDVCCAQVAAIHGWDWHRAARAIRKRRRMGGKQSMVGVRLSAAEVRALAG